MSSSNKFWLASLVLFIYCASAWWVSGDRRALMMRVAVPVATEAAYNPGTNGLIAAWDFADASDSFASYDLIATNNPGYTADPITFGSATNASLSLWIQPNVDSAFANTATNWSYAMRYRFRTGGTKPASTYHFYGSGVRTAIRIFTVSSNQVRLLNYNGHFPALATNEWTSVVATFDIATSNFVFYLNGSVQHTNSAAPSAATGDFFIGGQSATDAGDFDYDYVYFWRRTLSSDDAVWLYNTNGTRTFSDFE